MKLYVTCWRNFETMRLVYVIWTSLSNEVGGFAQMSLRLLSRSIPYEICTPFLFFGVLLKLRKYKPITSLWSRVTSPSLGQSYDGNHATVPKPVALRWIIGLCLSGKFAKNRHCKHKKRSNENCAYVMGCLVLQIYQSRHVYLNQQQIQVTIYYFDFDCSIIFI